MIQTENYSCHNNYSCHCEDFNIEMDGRPIFDDVHLMLYEILELFRRSSDTHPIVDGRRDWSGLGFL